MEHQTQTTTSRPAVMVHQPVAARPFFPFLRLGIDPTNVPFARRALNTCPNLPVTSGCTRGRSPSNVTRATRPSASHRTCSITRERTAANVHSSVPSARRVLSTAPTLCATCSCILASTYSNVIYANCTSKSRQSCCITPATPRVPAHSAVQRVAKDSSGHLTFASTSAHTRRSAPSTVMSVR